MLLIAATGIALQAGSIVRSLRAGVALDAPRTALWLQVNELLWFFTVAAGLFVFLVIYVSPHVL